MMNIDNLFTIILSDNPGDKMLENEDLIFGMIPELKNCKGFNQNNPWHTYDVYEHILHVVSGVPNSLILRLAALFHDIGKPNVYFEDENGIGHFTGHWNKSQKIFEDFAMKYQLEDKLQENVSLLILYHDKNLEDLDDEENLFIIKQFDINGIEDLFQFKKADLLAQSDKYRYLLNEYNNQKNKILLMKQSSAND